MLPGGSRRLLEVVKTPLLRDGKVVGLLGIDRDITGHKEAATAAHSASRAKSNFLAKMSHEIRTPMNAIIGMAELALRANLLADARRYIFTVKQAGTHLLSIINDILDFSKIEMGKLEISPTDYSFSSMINDIISIVRMKVVDSQLRFAINVDSKIPNSLYGDETRIRQVLLNLLSNAIKFTEKGFVSLTVKNESANGNIVNLIIEVTDSGKGIKQEDVNQLFTEYFQIDYEKNKWIEGTGLGLVITRDIVKAMGGNVTVSSEYGKGSTFTVMLPQKKRSDEVLASVKNPEEINVIVYEQREIYATSFTGTLKNLGVVCTQVLAESDFYEKITNKHYTHIFIPFMLFEKSKDVILKFGKNAKIIVFTEFGAVTTSKNYSVIAMPAYSMPIANILNGITDNFLYSEDGDDIIRFTAPKANVLIVDDVQTNLKVAQGLLLPYKMNVDLCLSGKEALKAVAAKHYDLIFMDHKMPEMDGFEATKRIRKMSGEDEYYRDVPIVALTANAVSGIRDDFLDNGFNDFISKPIDIVKLDFVLERWLPKNKQKKVSKSEAVSASASVIDAALIINIEGIDVENGILLSGGTVELFYETLAIYYRDGLEKIKKIKTCLEEGDLELYTVLVHGLKSASANIGANELSETAALLEDAGQHSDVGYIELHTPGFLTALGLLAERIKSALEESKENSEKTPRDVEQTKLILLKLRAALEVLDSGIINMSIQELQKMIHADDVDNAITNISDKILLGEYDEAITLIDALLQ